MAFFVSVVASVLAAAATFLFTKSTPYTVAVLLITFPLATLFSSLFTSSSSSKKHSKRKRSSKNNFDALLNDEAQQQASRAKKAAKKAAVAAKKAAAQQQQPPQQAVSESKKSDVSASEGDDASTNEQQQVEAAAQAALAKKAAKKARQAAKKAEQKAAAEAAKQTAAVTQQQQQSTKTQTVVEKNNNKQAAKTAKPASAVKSAVQQATATAAAKPVEATVSSSRDSQSSNDGWTTKQGNENNKAKKSSSPQPLKQAANNKNNKQGIDANNEDVDRAKSVEINVPIEHHALLIGPKGATLQLLQQATGATIQMPRRELSSSTVTVSGSGESVNRVKGAIDSLVRLGYSSITHPGQVHDDINVDPKTIGVIIGPGGSTLKQIQSKTNTRVNLPKKNSDSNKCTIIGLKTDVKQAKQCIKDLIADGFSPLIHVGIIKQTVEFPHEKIALLIGPKGQTIKSIQGNTKTKINVNSNVKDGVTVIGSAEGCAQAAKEIQRLLIPVQPVNADDEEEGDFEEVENAAAWQAQHNAPSEDQLWSV